MTISYRTFFCDDLRSETGGKESYMGIFDDDITLNDIPAVLPRLVAVILFQAPSKLKKFEETFKLLLDGKALFSEKVSIQNTNTNPENDIWKGRVNFVLSPFVVEKEGRLDVCLGTDGSVVIGSLFISLDRAVDSK